MTLVAEKPTVTDRVSEGLHKYFGFESFKGNQKAIVQSVLVGSPGTELEFAL